MRIRVEGNYTLDDLIFEIKQILQQLRLEHYREMQITKK